MIVAYWRTLGDLGLTSVPGFSDPAAEKLLDGPLTSARSWRGSVRGSPKSV
jgi:hypothetical protein